MARGQGDTIEVVARQGRNRRIDAGDVDAEVLGRLANLKAVQRFPNRRAIGVLLRDALVEVLLQLLAPVTAIQHADTDGNDDTAGSIVAAVHDYR